MAFLLVGMAEQKKQMARQSLESFMRDDCRMMALRC